MLYPYEIEFNEVFEIVSLEEFNFNLIFDKKVFVQGEKIDIDYFSDTDDLEIDVFLFFPGGSTKNINLPFVQITDSSLKEKYRPYINERKEEILNFYSEDVKLYNTKINK